MLKDTMLFCEIWNLPLQLHEPPCCFKLPEMRRGPHHHHLQHHHHHHHDGNGNSNGNDNDNDMTTTATATKTATTTTTDGDGDGDGDGDERTRTRTTTTATATAATTTRTRARTTTTTMTTTTAVSTTTTIGTTIATTTTTVSPDHTNAPTRWRLDLLWCCPIAQTWRGHNFPTETGTSNPLTQNRFINHINPFQTSQNNWPGRAHAVPPKETNNTTSCPWGHNLNQHGRLGFAVWVLALVVKPFASTNILRHDYECSLTQNLLFAFFKGGAKQDPGETARYVMIVR